MAGREPTMGTCARPSRQASPSSTSTRSCGSPGAGGSRPTSWHTRTRARPTRSPRMPSRPCGRGGRGGCGPSPPEFRGLQQRLRWTMASAVTPQRFAAGMTFDEYVTYAGTPENLARESGWWLGIERQDLSGLLRAWYEQRRLSAAQVEAIRWLARQPDGPAKILVISEEWSSDCRRDVPMFAHLAEAGGLELRIFTRDGRTLGRGPRADPAESPNADIVNEFLREQDGRTYQSVPVAVFY